MDARSLGEVERDELIAALQARERFLTGILGGLESFVTVDAAWRLTFANDAAATSAGTTAAAMVGRRVHDFTPADVLEQVWPVLQVAMRERRRAHADVTDGKGLHYHCTAFPLADGGLAVYTRDITQRVRAEAELKEDRALLHTVLENSRDGINMLDLRSGRYLFMNEAQAALTGFTADEIEGISAEEAYQRVHPEDRHISIEQQQRITAGEDSDAPVEYRWQVKSGEYRWFSDRRRLVRDESGRPVALVGISRDITEAKEAEDALRSTEERYHSLFESIEEAFALCELVRDADGRVTDFRYFDVNPAFERELHVARAEAVGHLRSEIGVADPDVVALCAAAVEGGRPVRWELYSQTWGRWYDARVLPRGGDTFAIIFEDITDRKVAQEALRESEERFRGVFSSGAAAIAVGDLSGRLVLVNDAFAHLLGYEPEETVGLDFVGITYPGDMVRELPLIDEMLAGVRSTYQIEKRYVRKDGSLVWVDLHVGLLHGDDGEPRNGIAVAVDVTERKRAEEALRATAVENAAQAERTRLARDLHDSVTQALFAATMKAEALLVRDTLPEPALHGLQDVRRLNRGALAQMRTLLLELRGDRLQDVPLEQLLRYAVEAVESRCSAAVELVVRGEGDLPPAVHVALYRICQEALNNVARHSGAAHARVWLEVRPDAAHLVVRDDGCGFVLGSVDPSHYGLRSMRERAEEAGADFAVVTGPGAGTRIAVDWPGAC
jgi:PAS domain S-box-containing protein